MHMTITKNYITVDREKIDLYDAIRWAKENCPHYITNDYHPHPVRYSLVDFFFIDSEEAKKEMTMFLLKWT